MTSVTPNRVLTQMPVTRLKGAGPKVATALERLGIRTVADLLFHLPFRYEDHTKVRSLWQLRSHEPAVVEGEIISTKVVFGRRRSLVCHISDGSGTLALRFFHFSAAQQNALVSGARIRAIGDVQPGSTGLEMYHPQYLLAQHGELPPLAESLTPVYSITEGVTQRLLHRLIHQALEIMNTAPPPDLLPPAWLANLQLPALPQALRTLHAPTPEEDVAQLVAGTHPAVQRLVLEEIIAHQLALLRHRDGQKKHQAWPLSGTPGLVLVAQLIEQLPFQLTSAQQRVFEEISVDLRRAAPMLRLVQGDVGCGKTLVAALAALMAIGSGYQVALMAPTELLAEQHLNNFRRWFSPLGIDVCWLTGSLGQKARREVLGVLADGSAPLVIGTHALFQDSVQFQRLALAIIDEQHRFGVHQRLALREKGHNGEDRVPHQLVLTATPIPRTLAMSLYGDLDHSIIDELPPGRQPIETLALSATQRREEVVARVSAACEKGAQAYWICTLIDESEALQAEAAEVTMESLQAALPHLRVGLVHGRMKAAEKSARMAEFAAGNIQLLVATTVIEVGVDVPNASLMVIENAERLGLSQLHQLRGRVGRGQAQSYCVLLYQSPLSRNARARLAVMRETCDGFRIAEEDLRLRGPGEWLGTRQTGDLGFRIADLLRDEARVEQARHMAQQLLNEQPAAGDALVHRWLRGAEGYAGV